MSILLILAALAAPASEDRHVDAVEIFACDFAQSDRDWDVNYDEWPDLWTRRRSPAWPHYVKIHLEDDPEAVAGRCLTVDLNGAGASVSSPFVSVSDKFSYVIEARLKATGLKHSHTHVRIDFVTERARLSNLRVAPFSKKPLGGQKSTSGPLISPNRVSSRPSSSCKSIGVSMSTWVARFLSTMCG